MSKLYILRFRYPFGHLLGKGCSFGQSYVVFVMSVCSFGGFHFGFEDRTMVLIA